MDGTFKDEFQYRLSQSKRLARKLYRSHLSPLDAYMVYETRFRPALEYPLAVTTFTTKQLLQIQKPFIFLLLPKLGMNRHTPRAIIYGPIYRGGLGIKNLDKQQAILHFELFQGHIRRNDDLGKSLRIQISTQQLEVGCGDLFLNTDPNLYCYSIQNTRLSFLWKKCFKYKITITLQNSWIPQGEAASSPTIMDYAVKDKILHNNKLKLQQINRCRLYLKLMWPKDLLLNASSTNMDPLIIRGQRPKLNHSLTFPFQTKPDRYAIQLWKEFIYRTFCRIQPSSQSRNIEFHLVQIPVEKPEVQPLTDDDCSHLLNSIKQDNTTLRHKFQCLPEKFRHIIGEIHIPEDEGLAIINALKTGDALLASDGSFLQQSYAGTHAYKLTSRITPDMSIFGSAKSPKSNKMSSSPTEHYGAIAVLVTLLVLTEHHGEDCRKWPETTLLIDNKEVVTRGNNLSPNFLNVRTYLMHDYDLWMVLVELQYCLKLNVTFEWIKSHQISDTGFPLNKDEIALVQQKIALNDDVDKLASAAYSNTSEPTERGAFYAGIVCYHQDGAHVQDITKAISSIDSDYDLLQYYISKGWTMDSLKLVDWIGMETFMKNQSPIVRCKIVQMIHDWQNTGTQKQKIFDAGGSTTTPAKSLHETRERVGKCPLGCNNTEVPFHFMKCMTDVMIATRVKGLETIAKGLKKLKTAPSLTEAFIQSIVCWTNDVEYELDDQSHQELYQESYDRLFKTQSTIGWDNFMKGYIAKEWGTIQMAYYRHKKANSRKFTRSRWVGTVLTLLHQYRTDTWFMRNASLHGGRTIETKQIHRKRLLQEVRELYKRDRSSLPLADKDLFKLPLRFREKQGAQHLTLWIKRARLSFDSIVADEISSVVQTRMTNWLTGWNDEIRLVNDPPTDIITWQNHEIDRDKLSIDCISSGSQQLDGMSQLSESTDTFKCTE
jgi:hypothetical protein